MKSYLFFAILVLGISCKNEPVAQEKTGLIRDVGGPCEGCEALLEYQGNLSNLDTVPGFETLTPRMIVEGTVYESDGKTPARDVILYFHQTDTNGYYTPKEDAEGWGRRHGKHRAWVQTNANGRYKLFTYRPASYPNRDEAEHIHITVKEIDTNPYYIDAITFEDDPLLTQEQRSNYSKRGGSGICQVETRDSVLHVKRDIILGLNIPGYR